MANKAFNEIFPKEDAGKLINQFLANRLNWDVFDDDSYEYLAKKIDDYDDEETENDKSETIVKIDWETVKNQWESEIYDIPNYSITDASRYLNIPLATLKIWLNGDKYETKREKKELLPIIQCPSPNNAQLSFTNLVEAHILKVICQIDNISLDKVRITLDYLSEKINTNHPLATKQFSTDGVKLFMEILGNLVNLSHSQQLKMKEILQRLLTRVEWNENNLATRLYPELEDTKDDRILIIDPHFCFGKPTIKGTGVPTNAIAQLYNAGDSMEEIAEDYHCDVIQIEKAILFESNQQAA